MRYLVGIDNGSQSSKVTIFDEQGQVVSRAAVALHPLQAPAPGLAEHPGDDLWESIGEACRRAMAAFPGAPEEIAGVGLCTIRFCRALLRADGTLAHPVLSWMDPRVSRSHDPQDYPDADAAHPTWITTSSGYIGQRMTGRFRDTAANCQGLWPMDTAAWDWSTEPEDYAAAGMAREQLPELVQPGEVLGELTEEAAAHTGLPQGVPVVATANDKAVEALGCGLREDSELLISLGTYITAMSVQDEPVEAPEGEFWTNFASEPGRHLCESVGIRRGMWTVSWFRDLVGEASVETLNAQAEQVPAGSDGLMAVLDWLAPEEAPHRRGSLVGFDARHGRGHIHRAILEAIALTMHRHSRAMEEALGSGGQRRFTRATVSGGGAQSDLMMQIMADVFGLPTERAAGGADRGAALCAAVGTGVTAGFEEAAAAMVPSAEVWEPDPQRHALYRRLGALHGRITDHTDQLYRELAELELE
ncbi:FGGY-family carbohydrate kinase [Nesterenkonia cremea]|uniref:Kinase n=1 Tax=Nesterenkonia cremea TaxID=1882340 RepID=A0A917AUU2_9MICC|nr:FGGY family carbohydrate kinase [Nesterenkonia cremea]GGE74006.1 kinase [Nesterenkonia cremea]